jgi:hypothetical protein
LTIADI